MAGIDVSRVVYATVQRNHLTGPKFVARFGDKVFGWPGVYNESVNAKNAKRAKLNTCAMRLSMALHLSGIKLPLTSKAWLYRDGASRGYIPASAGEYVDRPILRGFRFINKPSDIVGQHGILYFGWTGMGHITLWNGRQCHFNDAYWRVARRVAFCRLR